MEDIASLDHVDPVQEPTPHFGPGETGALEEPKFFSSRFTLADLKDAHDSIESAFAELRAFANQNTNIDDPMHVVRVEARAILETKKFRDLPNELRLFANALETFDARYQALKPVEEAAPAAAEGA